MQSVFHVSPNMWSLIDLGSSVSLVYSIVVVTVSQGLFPTFFDTMRRVLV